MELTDIGWGKARKMPLEVHYRHPIHTTELITTLEGNLTARQGEHYVILGVEGELYPIEIGIFNKTYNVIVPLPSSDETQEVET